MTVGSVVMLAWSHFPWKVASYRGNSKSALVDFRIDASNIIDE